MSQNSNSNQSGNQRTQADGRGSESTQSSRNKPSGSRDQQGTQTSGNRSSTSQPARMSQGSSSSTIKADRNNTFSRDEV